MEKLNGDNVYNTLQEIQDNVKADWIWMGHVYNKLYPKNKRNIGLE